MSDSSASDKNRESDISALNQNRESDISAGSVLDLDSIRPQIEGVAQVLLGAMKSVAPSKASLELSVDFELRGGQLFAAFVQAGSKSSIKITLEWTRSVEGGKLSDNTAGPGVSSAG